MGKTKIMPDYKDSNGLWRKTIRVNKVPCWTVSGKMWSAMRLRCIEGGVAQTRRPTYSGCTVSEEFEDFQFFCNWHRSQAYSWSRCRARTLRESSIMGPEQECR